MRELDQSHKEISAEIQEVWADYYNFPLLFSEIMQKDFKHRVIPRLTVRNAKNTANLLRCCCPVTFSSLNEPHTCVVQGLPLLLFVSSLLVFCLQNSLNLDEFHPVARFLTKLWFGSYLLCFQVLQPIFQRQKFDWIIPSCDPLIALKIWIILIFDHCIKICLIGYGLNFICRLWMINHLSPFTSSSAHQFFLLIL